MWNNSTSYNWTKGITVFIIYKELNKMINITRDLTNTAKDVVYFTGVATEGQLPFCLAVSLRHIF